MKNINQIKQNLSNLLDFYQNKRSYHHYRIACPIAGAGPHTAKNEIKLIQQNKRNLYTHIAFNTITVLPFLVSFFSLGAYAFFGHTNRARVQPIQGLLTLVCDIQDAESKLKNNPDLYRQKLLTAQTTFRRMKQEITSSTSGSKEYKQLIKIVNSVEQYLNTHLNEYNARVAFLQIFNGKQSPVKDSDKIIYDYLRSS